MKLKTFTLRGTSHRHLLLWTTAIMAWIICPKLVAEDNPADWTTQSKSYFYEASSDTGFDITQNLESDDFGFTPSPGNYDVTVTFAQFDDEGTIGGSSWTSWPNTIQNYSVPDGDISVDGNRLSINMEAIEAGNDDGGGDDPGWNITIQWRAKKKCESCSQAGTCQPNNECVKFIMNLGKDLYQQDAGEVLIYTNFPSPILAQPVGLQASLASSSEEIMMNGALRQLRTSQVLADIVASNSFCYFINFYTTTNFTPNKYGGLYVPIGQPFSTFEIRNPDASTNTYNRLQINQTGVLGTHEYDYVWLANSNAWVLTTGGGLRAETRSKNWDTTQTYLTETNIVLNPDNSIAFKQVETYEFFPWGQTNLVQRVVNPDGLLPQTNTWTYYTNAADTLNYSHLAQITQPSGYWERYTYDTFAHMIEKAAQFGNVGTNAPDSQCRVWTYNYGSSSDGNEAITTNIETLLGQEIKRTYTVEFFGGTTNIVCQTPGASMSAADNLITVSFLFTNGPFNGLDHLTQNPDGTVSINQYSTNASGMTTINFTGAPDSTGTNVVDGTKTINVVDLGGNSISNATYDVISGLQLSSTVTLQKDAFGRPTLVQYNDGTTVATQYGCCGIVSQTDRDGVTTSYNYDDLKRVTSLTCLGITTLYTYDAAGRVLTTTRQGTDNSEIEQNISTYNPAGWLVTSTNALNFGTFYGQSLASNGNTIKSITNADGSTSIDTYLEDGTTLMSMGTATFGISNAYGVEIPPGETVYRAFTQQFKLNTNGAPSGEWTKTYVDMLGRIYKTLYASTSGSPVSQSFYNTSGQLSEQVDSDGVTTLYQYNNKGQLAYTATDMNTNSVIDFGSTDRITEVVSDVTTDHGVTVNRTRTFVWNVNNSVVSNLVSIAETSADGLQTWNMTFNNGIGVTNHTVTSYDSIYGYRTVTAIAPDASTTINVYLSGRLAATTVKDANGVQIGQSSYGYDAHGRQNTVTDSRNGTTTNYFNNADQIVATLTPSPDGIQSGQFTTNILDSMGRVIQAVQADGTRVTNVYYLNGLLEETYGTRTFPVLYTYDYAGRMKTMTTWTNFVTGAGAAVTTWNYDGYRGFLTNKIYADGKGPSYTYTSAGRLSTRIWARGIITTNFYDNAGTLLKVNYSDATPGVTNSYDRLGRLSMVVSGGITNTLAYNDANLLLSETYSGGPLNGLSVTNGYDVLLRRTNLTVNGNVVLSSTMYSYDAASRLSTVSDGTNNAAYTYLANSPLVGQITYQSNNVVRMTTSRQYDYLDRLTQISSAPGANGASPLSFNYVYNTANQRTSVTNVDNSYWVYQYDSHGEVTSGKKYWADGTPVAGQQFTFNFDDIGNRQGTASGGDATGSNLRTANYTNNALNEIISRSVPGYVTVLGSANSNATVTVNLQRPYRNGNYFQDEMAAANTSTNVFQTLTNLAVLNNGTNADIVTTNMGNYLLPKTPQVFQYDADGNLTNDGVFTYGWDAENRLTNVTSMSVVLTNAQVEESWNYLPDGRWSQVVISTWQAGKHGSSYVPVATNKFVWDGQVLAAEVGPGNALIRSYMRGLNLSELLEVKYAGSVTTNCFVAYGGNGNVTALVNAADGTTCATYEYDPFGQTLRMSGPMAKANPMRFSAQYSDDIVGDIKYTYRCYMPSIGRWIGRDKLEERGGVNIYSFIGNDPINQIDINGNEGGLWGDLLDCAKTFATSWVEEYSMKAEGANDLYNLVDNDAGVADGVREAGDPKGEDIGSKQFCNGFTFHPTFSEVYEPSSLGEEISECLLSKAKKLGIDVALSQVQDENKREALKKILGKVADIKTDTEAKYRISEAVKCQDSQVNITLTFSTVVIYNGSVIATLPTDIQIGPYHNSELARYDEKYCSCCDCDKKSTNP